MGTHMFVLVNATTSTAYVSGEYSAKGSAARAAARLSARQGDGQVDTMVFATERRHQYEELASQYADVVVYLHP